ncbi:class I SAM-dependent methyltransferase [Janthinobacterium fluminis]|uniref:Class I SAM-dependent methyltransferase n=1 Tax=Janthinobacterium fluminis TaxID=2987524 RepID=A0ABT5K6Z5_9BURK|nr:class I SAM-dependent methyltransferase [Janthinobacterium fluminis]MDC8760183.1 class I SAM-dependent methyltransferase [Janthinobacterium fluminis]
MPAIPSSFDLLAHNAAAWDRQARADGPWSQAVDSAVIAAARQGRWHVRLTPGPLPAHWLGDVTGMRILCLAAAGGQQAPVLAAAGADVTVLDLSAEQLAKDALVAARDGLALTLEQGDMRDLSRFADQSFDLVFHPIANQYVPAVEPVWDECYRVLRHGGALLSSFFNPAVFITDRDPAYAGQGLMRPRYQVPYSDLTDLDEAAVAAKQAQGQPMLFGHSLASQIGGQIAAGFVLAGFVEEMQTPARFEIEKFMPSFIATRSLKL